MEGTKPRTASSLGMFDLLKGVGMLLIVFAHTSELYPVGDISTITPVTFFLFAYRESLMAAFYIASGYGFRKRSIGKCISQQFKTLFKPYAYTGLATTIAHFVIHYKTFGNWNNAVYETYKVLGGFVLDALFGDPAWLPHPVVLMGRCISRLEKFLRARLPGTPQGELLGGAVTAFCLPVGTFLVTSLVCLAAAKLSPWLGLAVQMFWCGQALAARGLAQESTNVYNELVRNDLPAARKAVSRIVGRDTQNLTAEGVTKAAVETVAENASDGVIAPLLYMLIGGAPLALTYKAINTMDSMLGYKNEKYLYFGRAAAKLDDLANYIPSRLAALLWVAAAAFTGNDAKGAWRIWRRDRRNHASPNSAQTESACAGALGVQLAGPAYYFGEYYPKPTIGDALRPIEPQDILRANRMMYVASGFALAWGAAIRGYLV